MKSNEKKLTLGLVTLYLAFVFFGGLIMGRGSFVFADDNADKLGELNRQIEEYERQIKDLKSKANTLSNQIAQFNAQIKLTELKINQTQEQITLLGGRIDQLRLSLADLQNAFQMRAVETYRLSRTNEIALLFLSLTDLRQAMAKYHYLIKIQEADRNLLTRLQTAQETYTNQKTELEDLNQVLGVQKETLDNNKTAKNYLLAQTKNNEKQYQALLAQAKAEFEAIQAIIAGGGEETEVGHVNQGDRIAEVIQGTSCNSSGSHLHFMVVEGRDTRNPFGYLKPIDFSNCSGFGECSGGDPFNPTGGWDWPLSAPVKFSQGYGSTWAVANTWVGRIYSFHNGIDINNESNRAVAAVRSGKLFRGSYSGYQGCKLRYVRVDHDENNLETYYLHINY